MSKARQLADLGNVYDDGALSNRNLIINGAMQVAQRGTSVTGVTSSGYRTCDRFVVSMLTLGTWTISQSTDAPEGFANSLKLDCTTADASPAAGDYLFIDQRIEGQNLQMLKKGTSNALPLTLSFWVKSSKTGDFQVNLNDIDNTRIISSVVTINATSTWEQKTITFDGDTTGTLGNDNDTSLRVEMWFDAGSNWTSGATATAWESLVSADRAAGTTLALGNSTSNELYITGVQLEVGDTATPFEHEPYSVTLQKCQRYYQIWGAKGKDYHAKPMWIYNSTQAATAIDLPQDMRAAPSFSVVGNVQNSSGGSVGVSAWALYYAGNWVGCSALEAGTASPTSFRLDADSFDSITSGGACGLYGGTDCYITLDSEL